MNQFLAKSKIFARAIEVIRNGRNKKPVANATPKDFRVEAWLTKYHAAPNKDEEAKLRVDLSKSAILPEQLFHLRNIFREVDGDVMFVLEGKIPHESVFSAQDQERLMGDQEVWRLIAYWRDLFKKKKGRVLF